MKLALLALILFQSDAGPERLVETMPDGRRVEREVEREVLPDGERIVNVGEYLEFWPDGTPAVEGQFRDGLQTGRWKLWHPDGSEEGRGAYRDGLRTGKWSMYDRSGELIAAESGDFEIAEPELPTGERASRGERRDGVRHGSWRFFWESGALKAVGRYVEGAPEGPWSFYHPDGTLDPQWITGFYTAGERTGDMPPELVEAFRLDPMTAFAPRSGGAYVRARKDLELLREKSGRAADKALTRLLEACEDPSYLSELIGMLEPSSELLAVVVDTALAPRWSWPMWPASESGLAPDEARMAALRESSALRFTSPAWRYLDYPSLVAKLLIHPPLHDGTHAGFEERVEQSWYAGRFEDHRRGDRNKSIQAALDWLVLHQEIDGSWDPANMGGCTECGGAGEEHNRWGVTGLALLALMGNGHTPADSPEHAGEHGAAVAKGLGWLLQQQEDFDGPEVAKGLIGMPPGHGGPYSHAIDTLALSEALFFHPSPRLRMGVERAVDFIQRVRNPGAGWRYSLTPKGDNDVSVTAWMTVAMSAAGQGGVDLDLDVLWEVVEYLDAMIDESTGRCGYDSVGSLSSRVERVNDHYPPEKGEAMTAAALTARYFIGQDPGDSPSVRLMFQTLPEWDAEGFGCDMYYWYYGSQAAHQIGGERWETWDEALVAAALEGQRAEGHAAGSWDPAGPWGYAGGRVYATAMMALSLEADRRIIRLRGDD